MSYLYNDGENESHLLNVIVSLEGQELICDVNRNKDRNIHEFNEIDAQINQQITENHNALKQIPEVYSNVLGKIQFAQCKIKSCKEKIDRCKTSLQCQRDDLKRLYLDSVTNGQILDLLARIDKVREVSGVLDNYIKCKHYQHATKLLKTNVALLEGNLSSVDALKEVKEDLKKRKDTLHVELIRQLQNHLYLKSPSAKEKVQLFRSGEPPEMDNEEEYEDEEEDLTKDPEDDTYKFLKLLIQSLQQLDRLDDTIEVIEKNMESELKNILINTAQDLLYKKRLTNQIEDQPTLFLELLEECFAKYRAVAASHHVVINAIEHLRYNRHASRYTTNLVWGNIQTCVEILLKDYLAVDAAVSTQTPTASPISYVAANNDLTHFFARTARRPDRVVRGNLFCFESSVTGMTISSECRTQQYNSADMTPAAQELPTLCQKSPHNITLVFKQITSFIKEINNVINMTGNQLIPLQHFLNDFVDERFLPTLQNKVKHDIADATEGNSGLNMVKLPATKIGWPRPLLQGTLKVQQQLVELRALMNRMPKYCNKFLDIIYELLKYYKRICLNTFNNIVGINTLGIHEMVCHVWFKDSKLTQIIRQLPVWQDMFEGVIRDGVSATHADIVAAISTHQGKDVLDKDCMIAESERLVQLAQLQDSIMWLVKYVESFAENLQCDKELQDQLTGGNKLLEDCRSLLSERCNELLQLAEDCLLILYLEIRVQCYYHLLIVLRKQDYKVDMVNSDPDSGITLLNKFLSHLEEKIRDFLPPSHTKFLFDGLGYVMSSIIIVNASYIKEINAGGLQKMSRNILALQQNLTNITLTCELDLERARFYYELLYQKPDEILRNIVEQQKRFTKSEYVELIQLHYRSNRTSKNKRSEKQLNLHLVKLNEIMETAGDNDTRSN